MEIVKTKLGERYKEKVRLPNGKVKTKTFPNKTLAKHWKRQMELDKTKGELGIIEKPQVAFKDVAVSWFQARVENVVSFRTVQSHRSHLNGKLIPYFGEVKVDRISLNDIEDLKRKYRSEGLNPKTINKVMSSLRQVFLYALDCGYVSKLPFNKSLLMKTVDRQYSYFEDHEIKSLLIKNRNERIFPIIYLFVHTGMRPGEIFGLCWDRVNFNANRIEITRTMNSRRVVQETTKGRRARYFPMNESLKEFFKELRKSQIDPRFVFLDEKGQPYSPDHFNERLFRPACKRAGVRELRFYDLRHTFASHFMMKGGNLFELQKLLGHANIEETMIYAHLSPEHLEKASQIVNFGISFGQEKADGPFLALAK